MENTEVPIQNEELTTVIQSVTEETPETTTTTTTEIETTPVVNGEETTTTTTTTIEETPVTENVEEQQEEIVPPTDEQENVTDTNATVPPTSLSPSRINVPLKEVNESEKEETPIIPNGTENGISKKRELEQEDEPTEETTNDNDERNGLDQTKKLKISEATDTPIIEVKESEKNLLVNGNTAVEV